MSPYPLHNILFLDIETVSQYPAFTDLSADWQELWRHKADSINRDKAPATAEENGCTSRGTPGVQMEGSFGEPPGSRPSQTMPRRTTSNPAPAMAAASADEKSNGRPGAMASS